MQELRHHCLPLSCSVKKKNPQQGLRATDPIRNYLLKRDEFTCSCVIPDVASLPQTTYRIMLPGRANFHTEAKVRHLDRSPGSIGLSLPISMKLTGYESLDFRPWEPMLNSVSTSAIICKPRPKHRETHRLPSSRLVKVQPTHLPYLRILHGSHARASRPSLALPPKQKNPISPLPFQALPSPPCSFFPPSPSWPERS